MFILAAFKLWATWCRPQGQAQTGLEDDKDFVEVDVVAYFVICCAANFGTVIREQIVLEIPIWSSFEIFLYPFHKPDWVIINTLHKCTSCQGKYVVTCVLRIFLYPMWVKLLLEWFSFLVFLQFESTVQLDCV